MAVNSIRFTGLASGLDTESIVNSMLTPYQNKVDAKKQEQTMMEWRKDAWKTMNSKLFNFYDKFANKMRLESTFNRSKVSSSNAGVIEFDKNSSLPEGTHDIKVNQLANGTRVNTSQIEITEGENKGKKATGATKLSELGIKDGTKINITVPNGDSSKTVEVELKSDMTLDALATKMKEELPDYNVSFDSGMGALFISSKHTGVKQSIEITSTDSGALKSLGINSSDVIRDDKGNVFGFISGTQIKDNEGTVIGSYDGTTVKDMDGKTLNNYEKSTTTMSKIGQDAEVVYNGVTSKFDSNSISINGLTMTLQSKGATTLVSTQDTDGIFDTIKEFVNEYNTLIDELNTKVNAESARSYKPLTDAQKESMTDKEIEAWEKKIKDSLFRNDESLKGITQTMRNVLGSVVEVNGEKISLASIGITTGSWEEKGKLHIDEDKLKAAISKDSDKIAQLFAANGKTDEANDNTKGLGDRLYDTITTMTMSNQLRSKYSFYNDKVLDKQISTAKTDYSDLVDRLTRMETMYYKKFTAMEKMMQNLNSQSSWITQQLG